MDWGVVILVDANGYWTYNCQNFVKTLLERACASSSSPSSYRWHQNRWRFANNKFFISLIHLTLAWNIQITHTNTNTKRGINKRHTISLNSFEVHLHSSVSSFAHSSAQIVSVSHFLGSLATWYRENSNIKKIQINCLFATCVNLSLL